MKHECLSERRDIGDITYSPCATCYTARSGAPEPPPAAQVERVRKFYEPTFRRVHDHAEVRLRDREQLEQIAGDTGRAASSSRISP